MQVCILLQTDNHTSNTSLCFLQAGCPSCFPTYSVKALKATCLFLPLKKVRQLPSDLCRPLPLFFPCLLLDPCVPKGSPYSITKGRVPELIPVLGSQHASDVNHKPEGTLPLLSARPAVTPETLNRAATNFAAWWLGEQRHNGCEQFA